MPNLTTSRLIQRHATLHDAPFILRLLNEPSWLRYIGDRSVHNLDDARQYIQSRLLDSYQRNGFGLYVIELQSSHAALGLCGLIRRSGLEHVDIGYALLPEYWGQGYAFEAAFAVLDHARDLGIQRLAAITLPDNASSVRLLEKLGFQWIETVRLPGDNEDLSLYERDL